MEESVLTRFALNETENVLERQRAMWDVRERERERGKVCISQRSESNIVWFSLVNDINFQSAEEKMKKTKTFIIKHQRNA